MPEQIDRFLIPSIGVPPTVFVTSQLPDSATIQVYRNGELLYPGTVPTGDYTLVGTSVTVFVTANSDRIQIVYQYGSASGVGAGLSTAQDFLYQAIRHIAGARPGYVPGPEILADGMTEWGLMFDEWNTDRLMQYSTPDLSYTVTGPGSRSSGNGYTIGPVGADITGPRPVSIIRANLVLNPLSSNPVYIPMSPMSTEDWAAQSVRKIPAINIATKFYYDPQWPLGVFNVFPPVTAGTVFELFQFGALVVPATSGTAYTGPPGYSDAIVKSLAARMYYLATMQILPNKKPFALVVGQATIAVNKLRKLNRPLNQQPNDLGNRGAGPGFFDSNVRWTGQPY